GVNQRTAELGVRRVLGASRPALLLAVLRQGLAVTVVGLAVGTLAALVLARTLSTFLFLVQPTDPMSFVIGAAFILLAGLGANLLPAWRATRIEPMNALRG